MAQKFTTSAQQVLQAAQSEAIRREHSELQPEHVVLALLDSGDEAETAAPGLLQLAGGNPSALRSRLVQVLERLPRVSGAGSGQVYPSPAFNKILAFAEDQAKKLSDEYITGEHFLLAAAASQLKGSGIHQLLQDFCCIVCRARLNMQHYHLEAGLPLGNSHGFLHCIAHVSWGRGYFNSMGLQESNFILSAVTFT